MGAYTIGIVMSVFSFLFLTIIRRLLEMTTVKHVRSPEFLGSEPIEK